MSVKQIIHICGASKFSSLPTQQITLSARIKIHIREIPGLSSGEVTSILSRAYSVISG